VGHVGIVIAFGCVMHPSLSDDLILYLLDIDNKKLIGESADLQQAVEILHSSAKIIPTNDIPEADVYVIAAGRSLDDRESLYEENKKIIENYLPEISRKRHENSLVLMVTNPSTKLAQLALNYVPLVIPIGNLLDNARLRLCKATGSHEKPDIQAKYLEVRENKGWTAFAPATECLIRILQWKR
jgi:malate/lactate dehydrogenase